MLLGEFEYDTLETGFRDEDGTSKFFTLVLLVALVIFGSITMLNLFVGVVVSDIGALQSRVDFEVDFKSSFFSCTFNIFIPQILEQLGQFCILVENLLPSWVTSCGRWQIEIEDKIEVNVHDLRPDTEKSDENEWMLGFSEQIKNKLLKRFNKNPRKPLYQDEEM